MVNSTANNKVTYTVSDICCFVCSRAISFEVCVSVLLLLKASYCLTSTILGRLSVCDWSYTTQRSQCQEWLELHPLFSRHYSSPGQHPECPKSLLALLSTDSLLQYYRNPSHLSGDGVCSGVRVPCQTFPGDPSTARFFSQITHLFDFFRLPRNPKLVKITASKRYCH